MWFSSLVLGNEFFPHAFLSWPPKKPPKHSRPSFRILFSLVFLNSFFLFQPLRRKGYEACHVSLRMTNSKNMAGGIEAEQSLFPEEGEFEE